MTIREMTAVKLFQLPDEILKEVDSFIDFMIMRHQLEVKSSNLSDGVAPKWQQWFDEVDRLELIPHEPVNEYQEAILDKYRNQGLDL
ncbi:hypothetical protein H6F44_02230 [Pseudanabaena sp. FACHB-1277]|uniref:DUF2281 domain-containing protein n=1 Tax=Pseudanabaena cinerea FACHB-1277 TaxID=2949581 RepID=A0A926UPS1_9CYAN|nr:hypothetical protein [Pseudanabaena cinerea]MBD2148950.1 hypothetical protein [Pseudanabaena cinerea FACHB-1277]